MGDIPEAWARTVFQRAIDEGRCAEVLECLFDGGSVTIDAETGRIALASLAALAALETEHGD